MTKPELSNQLSKTERVPQVFTDTIEINRFDAETLIAHLESDLRTWECNQSPTSIARVQILRYYHRKTLELIHGVKNGTDPVTQQKIDRA